MASSVNIKLDDRPNSQPGAGNAPKRPELTNALREACDRGVVIVAISQCTRGAVSDAYEAGRNLLQTGVIPGGDMTPEVSDLHRTCFSHIEIGRSVRSQNYLTYCPNLPSPWWKSGTSWVHLSAENSHGWSQKRMQYNPPRRPWTNGLRKSRGSCRTLSGCPVGRTIQCHLCRL